MSATIGFYGGVGSVTGANFMLDTGTAAILIDCGLEQGDDFAKVTNGAPFIYDPAKADVLLVTHAHADHIGKIPKLVREGFTGSIYSTEATKQLARVMLEDALHIMEHEARRDGTDPLFGAEDIEQAFDNWNTKPYYTPFALPDGITATFLNSGHILGSAIIELTREGKKVVFTGDIGNVPQPLMAPPDIPKEYDYLVMESVYGDRVHEDVAERSSLLKAYIEDTIAKKGTLIIPAFSLERTQGMLYEINNLIETKQILPIKTYLDSPLAIKVTEIYRRSTQFFKDEVKEQIEKGDDIFSFDGLSFTETVKESAKINRVPGPKIIIAGSGMSHGGRIRAHEKELLDEPTTTVLLVGYQTVGSVGRLLQDGAKSVFIDRVKVKVKAKIATIRGYSGHADRDQLLEFVHGGATKVKQVFVTMGEEKASLFLTQRLRDYLGVNAVAPEANTEVEIDF
ncbi:MAG TPA: MBL fold metallo-hydrolase [Candidatus Paceibacterota bacterium]